MRGVIFSFQLIDFSYKDGIGHEAEKKIIHMDEQDLQDKNLKRSDGAEWYILMMK